MVDLSSLYLAYCIELGRLTIGERSKAMGMDQATFLLIKNELEGLHDQIGQWKEKFSEMENSRATFILLLGRYGRHDNSCPLSGKYIGGKKCSCGYKKILEALKEASKS